MRRLCAASLLGLLVGTSLAAPGAAQTRDPAAAEALFRAGLDALDRGDWAHACAKFDASLQLDPSAGTSINVARCFEHDGKVARAWAELQRAQVLAREAPEQRRRELEAFVTAEIARIEPRLPRLRIVATDLPPGAEVRRDGIPLNPAVLGEPLPVDAGHHEVEATAPGYQTGRWSVVAAEGATAELLLRLEIDRTAGQVDPEAIDGPGGRRATTAPPSRVLPISGVLLLGLGVGGMAIGTIAGANALGAQSDIDAIGCDHDTQRCPDEARRDQAQSLAERGGDVAAVSTISFVVGGVLLASGATLLIVHATSSGRATTPSAAAPPSRRVAVAPTLGADGGGLWIDGSF